MRRVFLSYRGADAADYARPLRAQLIATFGEECVAASPGEAQVILAFIGPRWLADDGVRDEIAAFPGGKLAIVVLSGRATLPPEEELPEALRPLAHANVLEIREPASEFDVEAVARQLTDAIHPLAAAARPSRRCARERGGARHRRAPPRVSEPQRPRTSRKPARLRASAAREGTVIGTLEVSLESAPIGNIKVKLAPAIRPVILEGPPIVEPWEELAHLHFNDRLVYFMRPPGDAVDSG